MKYFILVIGLLISSCDNGHGYKCLGHGGDVAAMYMSKVPCSEINKINKN